MVFTGFILSATHMGLAQYENNATQEKGALEELPGIIKLVTPEYPPSAKASGLEGTVWIKVWVGKDGSVKEAIVEKSDKEVFNQTALSAATQCKFSPAKMNGTPVDIWVKIPFIFRKAQS